MTGFQGGGLVSRWDGRDEPRCLRQNPGQAFLLRRRATHYDGVGVPSPNEREGATPKRRFSAISRPATLPMSPIILRRKAAPEPSCGRGELKSRVTRRVRSVPKSTSPERRRSSCGVFEAWLTTPPVDPRPNVTDDGPCNTCTS